MILKSQKERLKSIISRASYTFSPLFQDSFIPLFVIAPGRSGSGYLTSLLFSFDEIFMHNEIFTEAHDPLFYRINGSAMSEDKKMLHLKKVLQSPSVTYCKVPFRNERYHKRNALYRGCKIMDNSFSKQNISLETLFDFFPSSKALILYREDLALQYLSLQYAKDNDVWHSPKVENLSKVTIKVKRLLKYANKKRLFNQSCYEASEKFPDRTLFFSYEALCNETDTLFKDTICPFLEISCKRPTSILKKQNTMGYHICENWHEVAPQIPEKLFNNQPPFLPWE